MTEATCISSHLTGLSLLLRIMRFLFVKEESTMAMC